MYGLPDIPGARVRDVGLAPGAGREPNISMELPRRRSAILDAAAFGLRVFRSCMQMDVPGGVVRWHRDRRDHIVWRRGAAHGQSAVVVPENQPHAMVVVSPVATFAQERKHGQTGQLQIEADPPAGHYHPGSLRTPRRRVSPSRGRPRQAERARGIVAGHRCRYRSCADCPWFPVRQVRYPEEAQKRPEQTLIGGNRVFVGSIIERLYTSGCHVGRFISVLLVGLLCYDREDAMRSSSTT